MTEPIQSKRLELRAMTPAFLKASINGNIAVAGNELAITLPADWPCMKELLALRLRQLQHDPALQPWLLRAMCHIKSRTMIGYIGFHTSPGADYLNEWVPGAVEFGFTVFPAYRRQGYATEASRALMQWARHVHGVTNFVMTIRPNNVPSQKLAASLGFDRVGSHVDEVDGTEDVLALKLK